ncbi:MAG: hypothetical protein HZA06_04315 [Nitrospirae bacterium]|nr:hypothetical protein [Nitrospirota bacterium]
MSSSIKLEEGFNKNILEQIAGIGFTDGNMAKLLYKGRDAFDAIFNSVCDAKEYVCIEFYIFRDDETGIEFGDLLKQKASEGAKIYLLYDHFGSLYTSRTFWSELKEAGVELRASRTFKWRTPLQYLIRDHIKLIIVDGNKAFTGGLNIANEYRGYKFRRRRIRGWRDTGVLVEGPVASVLLDIFNRNWKKWGGEPLRWQARGEAFSDGVSIIPIFAASSKGRKRMRKLLYYSINSAKKDIYLTTAYFVPSRMMLKCLEEAVKRGVNVKLLVPGKSDVLAAYYAGRAFFTRLLKAGVGIYYYHGEILHAKTSVFDCCFSIVGSANLDFQSLRRNDEGNVGILDEGFGRQMEEVFSEDLKNSEKIEIDKWLKRPFREKIMEYFFAMFRRRL